MDAAEFIDRWKRSGGAEIANSQSFLKELCELIGTPQPEPTISDDDDEQNTYVFEKTIQFNNGDGTFSPGRVDLYRKDCFVLESKQGVERKDAEAAEALASITLSKKLKKGTAPRNTPGWDRAMSRARAQAKRYAEAWCPLVTGHLSPVTSLISEYELWQIDNDGLIGNSKGHFDSAEYERQLKHGVDG